MNDPNAILNTWIAKNILGLYVWEDFDTLWCSPTGEGVLYTELPNYAGSTFEAMKVLLVMQKKGYEWQMRTNNTTSYTASVWNPEMFEDGFYGLTIPTVMGGILPLTICLAVRTAIEYEQQPYRQ